MEVFYPRWIYPPQGGFLNSWFLAARLFPFIRNLRARYEFDIIDSHFGHPVGVAAGLVAAALKCPYTITLRGNETMHARAAGRRRWMSWAFRRAARIITVSESLRQFAISLGVDPARARTIPNGIDSDLFYPRPYAETRARLGMPANRPVILSAGYLIERKGHHRIVRALAEVRANGIPAELWIVGAPGREGQFERQLHETVRECGLGDAVHFTGAVKPETLAEYMSASDLFCLAELAGRVAQRRPRGNGLRRSDRSDQRGRHSGYAAVYRNMALRSRRTTSRAWPGLLAMLLRKPWDRERIAAWGRAHRWKQVAAETASVLTEAAGTRPQRTARK